MVFHSNRKTVNYPNLKINDIEIERVARFNFLGLIISSNLKWQSQMAISHRPHINKDFQCNRYNVQNEIYIHKKFYK